MAKKLEAPVELACCVIAKRKGWVVRKVRWQGRVGAPDRMFAKNRRAVFVEFKSPDAPDYRITQAREMMELRDAGLEVYFCSDVEAFEDILDGALVRANDKTEKALRRFRPRRKMVTR